MKKKSNSPQNKQRQRQKLSRKTVLIICAVSFSTIIGLTIFFNISHVDQTQASTANVIMVEDQTFVTEKTVEEPVLIPRQAANTATVYAKKLKALPVTNQHQ